MWTFTVSCNTRGGFDRIAISKGRRREGRAQYLLLSPLLVGGDPFPLTALYRHSRTLVRFTLRNCPRNFVARSVELKPNSVPQLLPRGRTTSDRLHLLSLVSRIVWRLAFLHSRGRNAYFHMGFRNKRFKVCRINVYLNISLKATVLFNRRGST